MTVIQFRKKPEPEKPMRQVIWPTGKQALDYIANYDRMKAALQKIAAMPVDDDESEYPHPWTGEKTYIWLRDDDARDYHDKAVDIARQTLAGKDVK